MYILVLDDEQHAMNALSYEVEKVFPKASICEETKASRAISWAKELAEKGEQLSYAFLDIEMRDLSGIEVGKQLKVLHPRVKLFFCTAYSEYAYDAFGLHAKGYLLKPIDAKEIEEALDEMVDDWRLLEDVTPNNIKVHTFGNFGVYVNGTLLTFEREKAKELLAYLVDRHGAPVSTEQIAMVLWEDEPYDRKLKNRTTNVISSLRNTLREANVEEILIKSWNSLALDISKIKCDAYEFEEGNPVAINSFHGEYMINYSWAETTLGHYAMIEDQRLNGI